MDQCTIILLGATGDLSKRKLIPAIYKLIENKKLDTFALVGVSIIETSIQEILKKSKKYIKDINPVTWKKLEQASYYQILDFYNDEHYTQLHNTLAQIEKKHDLKGNRLFYLATMPQHFTLITDKLAQHRIAHKHERYNGQYSNKTWSRVVYEKPFGFDLASARAINKKIAAVFSEEQAYRIDHYLGKELIGNIALVRFTNLFFQPLWNKKYIESVQIILSEQTGIEDRGEYYDSYGVVKDVIQNHCLQMLALVAMESPKMLEGEHIRNAKLNVLKHVVITDIIRGQYEGYHKEKGVAQDSKTETFAALRIAINNRRWQGVPFFIKAGKFLDKKETSIHIKFKQVKCLLTQNCPTDSNYLTIRVQPDEGFFLELNAKVPGQAYQITPVKMDFCHSCIFGLNTPEAYEVLLYDVIRGDQSTFLRFDEIERSWKIIDLLENFDRTVGIYKKNSSGPKELEIFNKKHTLRWRA